MRLRASSTTAGPTDFLSKHVSAFETGIGVLGAGSQRPWEVARYCSAHRVPAARAHHNAFPCLPLRKVRRALQQGYVLLGRTAQCNGRRSRQSLLYMMSLHFNNSHAKNRGIARNVLAAVRTAMQQGPSGRKES